MARYKLAGQDLVLLPSLHSLQDIKTNGREDGRDLAACRTTRAIERFCRRWVREALGVEDMYVDGRADSELVI